MFNIPILLTTYKRLENIDSLFEILKELNPEILFITSDGPSNHNDKKFIDEVRRRISKLKLEGRVIKMFSDKNLGIHENYYKWVSKAFETVDKLIFIEDDVLPSLSFFYFCRFILQAYENEPSIKMVNGSNFSKFSKLRRNDYLFTKRINSSSNAIWRRSFKEIQYIKENLADEIKRFDFSEISDKKLKSHFLKWFFSQLNTSVVSIEVLWSILLHKKDNYNIVYRDNLVKLGGVDLFASNTSENPKYLPRGIKRIYSMPQIEFDVSNLEKLDIISWDFDYDCEIRELLGEGDKIKLFFRNIEVFLKLFVNLRFDVISKKLYFRIRKFLFSEMTKNE